MLLYLWLGIGGAVGTIARFAVGGAVARLWGETFPFGTLLINISGSFAISLFATLTAPEGRWLASPNFRAFFTVGICGGYTTFSSFSLQTLNLAREGQWLYAWGNAVLSPTLCVLAAWLGWLAGTGLNSMKGR